MGRLDRCRAPRISVFVVVAIAGGGILLAYLRDWGPETFLVVPNSLVIVVYIAGMAAGVRLLFGLQRLLALIATMLCLTILPFAGVSLLLPLGVAVAAFSYHRWLGASLEGRATRCVPAR
jgi:amino acid efflux transporter